MIRAAKQIPLIWQGGRWLLAVGLIAGLAWLLAWLPLRQAGALLLALVGGTLAVIHPVWAVAATVASVPIQELVQLPAGLSVTQACLVLLVGAWGLYVLSRPDQRIPLGGLFLPLAALVGAQLLATSLTPYSLNEGLKESLRWATVLLIYLATLTSLQGTRGLDWRIGLLLASLLLAPSANALIGLRQFITGDAPASFSVAGGLTRAYGTIGQPNSFAGSLNMAWPLAIGLAIWAIRPAISGSQRHFARLVLVGSTLCGGLMLAALTVSFSRGGWLGAIGGGLGLLLVSAAMLGKTMRRYALQAGIVGASLVALVLILAGVGLLPNAITGRAESITRNLRLFDVRTVAVTPENFAVVERMAHLQAGWEMFRDRPLVGVGSGNYTLAYQAPIDPSGNTYRVHPWYTSRGHAHNYYLHVAAESGLLGLGSYLALLSGLAWTIVKALRRVRDWLWQGIVAGASGVVAAVATHNLFENLHVLNLGLQLGVIWALLAFACHGPSLTDETNVEGSA